MMLLSLSFMMNSIMNVRVGAHSSCPGNTRESKLQPRFSKKKNICWASIRFISLSILTFFRGV